MTQSYHFCYNKLNYEQRQTHEKENRPSSINAHSTRRGT